MGTLLDAIPFLIQITVLVSSLTCFFYDIKISISSRLSLVGKIDFWGQASFIGGSLIVDCDIIPTFPSTIYKQLQGHCHYINSCLGQVSLFEDIHHFIWGLLLWIVVCTNYFKVYITQSLVLLALLAAFQRVGNIRLFEDRHHPFVFGVPYCGLRVYIIYAHFYISL